MLLAAAPAHAHHVVVVSSDPAPGARLRGSPAAIVARFDQPIEMPGSSLAVTDARGLRVDRAATARGQIDQASLALELPMLLPGDYTVTWRVTSRADGEFNQGTYEFTVLPSLGPPPPDAVRLGALGITLLVAGALGMLGRGVRGRR